MLAIAALTLAAMFSGAAIYVFAAEHPARGVLAPRDQLAQWKPSYARGAVMQAGLAAASAVLGIVLWIRWHEPLWLAGGIAMAGAIAYTFLVIWRLNGELKATPLDRASLDTVAKLHRWGQLHLGRTVIGVAAMLLYAGAIYRS